LKGGTVCPSGIIASIAEVSSNAAVTGACGGVQRAHALCQHFQFSQDCPTPRLVCRGDISHVFKQALVYRGERLPQRFDDCLFPSCKLVHTSAHCLNLLEKLHFGGPRQFAPDA
jgi:hypothetical protein